MYLADCHTHSSCCSPDGVSTIDEICKAAADFGLSEICITEHYDVNGWNGEPYDFDRTVEEYFLSLETARERYGDRLAILAGREIGQATQNKSLAQKAAGDSRLDFVIGSLHNLRGYPDFYFLDYPDVEYCRRLAVLYFEELMEMAALDCFDVLGHLSYPLRYIKGRTDLDFDFSGFHAEISDLYRLLISRGRGIEVNMSGLRQPMGQTMPSFDLIKLYRECGGEIITIGSDAHAAKNLGRGIAEGQELLKAAGFRYFTVYRNRRPSFIKL
jgi:histidinol-phosphatase (PHP family)